MFRIEPSLTDPDAAIIVASQVQPAGKQKGRR
jgi:16S rRNA (guanine527-N7)-methyltransferase